MKNIFKRLGYGTLLSFHCALTTITWAILILGGFLLTVLFVKQPSFLNAFAILVFAMMGSEVVKELQESYDTFIDLYRLTFK